MKGIDLRKWLSRDSLKSYSFDYRKEIDLRIQEGESFVVETEDALNGKVKSEKDTYSKENYKPYSDFEPAHSNPLSGPVYIEGAEKGDVLEINIEKIIPEKTGFVAVSLGGPVSDTTKWPELGEPYTKIIKHTAGPSGTTRDGEAIYDDNIKWKLSPFIGTIGVCAEYEVFSSLKGQFPSGGNWDCSDIKEGSRLFLNCYHKGALLYLGDVHASQGDTEWCGSADEVKAEVTLSCKVIKNKKLPYARIEKKDSIIQLFADKPLEEAVHNAVINLMDWMITDYNISPRDAYVIISICPEFRINIYQMVKWVDFKYVAGAEIPKKYLNNIKNH